MFIPKPISLLCKCIVVIITALFMIALAITFSEAKDNELTSITTEWKALSANNRIVITTYQDPDIPQIVCYVSQAKTGGLSGSVGVAEDPSNFALSCIRTGIPNVPADLPDKEQLFENSTDLWFKSTRVIRIYDKQHQTVVYAAISRHLIEGSPFNAVAVVSLK